MYTAETRCKQEKQHRKLIIGAFQEALELFLMLVSEQNVHKFIYSALNLLLSEGSAFIFFSVSPHDVDFIKRLHNLLN